MRITESIITGTGNNKQRLFIKRPLKEFIGIAAYQKAFANEAEIGLGCIHSNLLRYIGLEKDEQGGYIALEYTPSLPLNRALVEDSLDIHSVKEAKFLMMQLFDAVEYLHGKGICHLNIRPENIYITRKAHDVKLANPAWTYLHCQPSFFLIKEKYTAPELFEEENPISYTACDIYSLGKVMEYLFSFCNLSAGIQRVIRKATQKAPEKRYTTIAEMRKALQQATSIDMGFTLAKIAAAALFLGLIYYGFKDEPASEESIQFAQETSANRKELPPSNKAEDTHESYYVIPTPSDSVARISQSQQAERDQQSKEYQQTTERLFKKELRKRAEKIIANIYTPQNMSLDDKDFQLQSLGQFNELDKIQRELAEQFNLDPILATRLSSDVISELTQENMKKLRKNTE